MREILFRGKDANTNRWHYGFITKDRNDIDEPYCLQKYNEELEYLTDYAIRQDSIGQYTGLKDKNGTKIFEGDIVEVWQEEHYVGDNKHYKAIVKFGNPNGQTDWGWQLKFIEKDFPYNPDILCWVTMEEIGVYCEVIGNIYDNPELIGGKG